MVTSTAQAAPKSLCGSCAPVPRGEKRRREIAVVATQVFFELGFADTTMHEIAARAGASKETLYRHFGSKEGLFAEIVENRAKGFLASLDQNFERPGSVADVLTSVGTRMLESILSADAVSLCRTVIAETPRNPELGRLFFASGPDRVLTRLGAFLEAAKARGEVACEDCELAALIYIGGVIGPYHLRRLISPGSLRLPARQIEAHISELVGMFMQRYAIQPAARHAI